ncbi:Outer membrane porin F precursor [Rhodobacteraceae bacterium SB2]|nr:Outer membrane porin F precursor [Rhodobacteraceae bacterium SB2]
MNIKFLRTSLLGALTLAPNFAWSDADTSKIFLLANQSTTSAEVTALKVYATLDAKLSEFMRAQQLDTHSSFNTKKEVTNFGKPGLSQAIRSADLSDDDFAITYSVTPHVKEGAAARTLKARAEGAIYNAATQKMLTTFNMTTPESVVLPKNADNCPQSCLDAAMSDLVDDLARELSFVLAQKVSFIQEDRVVTDTTDATAIKNRLSAGTERKPVRKTVTSNSGNFDVDVARSINIEVYFDFDSAALKPKAIEQLKPLGEALSSADLGSGRYLIMGHTDAKGSASYNQTLSEQRAASVRKYLVQRFPIQQDALVSIGLGETQLKRPAEPNAGINRRVEISLLLKPLNAPAPKQVTALNTYTLSFKLFSTADVLKVTKALEAKHAREIELLQSNTTSRTYSFETKLSAMELEEALLMIMLDAGVNVDNIRVTIGNGAIDVEQL